MSSSLSGVSLMDLNEMFPAVYSVKFDCSEANLEEIIEKVASFTSKVYAKFPIFDKKKRELLAKVGVYFNKGDDVPSERECAQFEATLKKIIITTLKENKYRIDLSTNYYPEKVLYVAAKSAFNPKHRLASFFPCKTSTTIFLAKERTQLCLKMKFKY